MITELVIHGKEWGANSVKLKEFEGKYAHKSSRVDSELALSPPWFYSKAISLNTRERERKIII